MFNTNFYGVTLLMNRPGRTPADHCALLMAAVLLVASWLTPNHYPPWACFYSEVPAIFAGALVVGVAIFRTRFVPRVSRVVGLLFLLAIVPWMQFAAGMIPYAADALLVHLYLWAAALCWWASASTDELSAQSCVEGLAWTFVVASLASTGISLYQYFGQSGLSIWAVDAVPGTRMGGNVAQPNHLATLLVCALASVVLLHARSRLSAAVALGLAGFLALGNALTQSRTSWLTLAVILVWTGLRSQRIGGLRLRPLAVLSFLSLYVLLCVVAIHSSQWLLLSGPAAESRLEVGLRPLMWKQMAVALHESPWFGYGWLQGHAAQAVGGVSVPGVEYSSYAHNLILDLMVWNGVPLGLGIAAALAAWYVKRSLAVKDANGWFMWAVVTAIATHAMLEYPHAYTYLLLPLAWCAGRLEDAANLRWRLLGGRPILFLGAAAVLLLSVGVMRDYLVVEEEGRYLRMELANIYGKRDGKVGSDRPQPDIWLLDNMRDTLTGARVPIVAGIREADLNLLRKVTKEYPNLFFMPRLIITLALNGHESEAIVELRHFGGIHGKEAYDSLLKLLALRADADMPALKSFLRTVASMPEPPLRRSFVAASPQ